MTLLPDPAPPVDPGGPAPPAPGAVAWHVAEGLSRPEGVCYHDASRAIFVANAGPDGVEEAGFLSKLASDGSVTAAAWVSGLTTPRGVRCAKGVLYVACGHYLAIVDVGRATVVARVSVPGSERLTGVAVDGAGVVYVSDPPASRIRSWDGSAMAVFAEGPEIEHPNGLLVIGNQLFVAGWGNPGPESGAWVPGRLFALNLKTKQKTLVTPQPIGHLGGLERDDKFNFLVSDRSAGKMYRISPRGDTTLLLAGTGGPAGHAFVPERRLLVLPRPAQDSVTAYDLAKLSR